MLRTVLREIIGVALLAGSIAFAACTSITGSSAASNAITTYAPVTGIQLDANSLFERQGCGHGPGVAFKYVVAVYGTFTNGTIVTRRPDSDPIAMSVNDCFTDAVFENLAGLPGASDTFSITVDVFDDVTYDKYASGISGGCCPIANPTPSTCAPPDGGPPLYCPAAIDASATWTTTCVARQEPNTQSLMACDPIVATGN